jgi:hypothetical protein
MQVQIIEFGALESGKFFEANCGKTSAYVWFGKFTGSINVCCKNASHKAFRGTGRTFWSIEEALAAYKSPEMKAIINAAVEA